MYLVEEEMEVFGEMTCQIESSEAGDFYTGTLKYRAFDVGVVTGQSQIAVRAQFQAICGLIADGGMVRHGIIMLGYHNEAFAGDVLLLDGEILGEWYSEADEWCHFKSIGAAEVSRSAPSPWMLHDSIADWYRRQQSDAF